MSTETFTKIPNELLDSLAMNHSFKAKERVYLFIIRYTLGFNREEAHLSDSFIAKGTGLHIKQCNKAIAELVKEGLVLKSKQQQRIITVVTEVLPLGNRSVTMEVTEVLPLGNRSVTKQVTEVLHKKENINKTLKKTLKAEAKKGFLDKDSFDELLRQSSLTNEAKRSMSLWNVHKLELGQGYIAQGAKILITRCIKIETVDKISIKELIDEAIVRNWQGFIFPEQIAKMKKLIQPKENHERLQ